MNVFAVLFRTKCLRTAKIIAIFSDFGRFEIMPEMPDVLAKIRESGNKPKCGISRTIAGRLTPMLVVVIQSRGTDKDVHRQMRKYYAGINTLIRRLCAWSYDVKCYLLLRIIISNM